MPGFWTRLSLAFRCFSSVLSNAEIPQDLAQELSIPKSPAALPQRDSTPATAAATAQPQDTSADAHQLQSASIQLLALFQRDGRLIDFLEEDITPYPDPQLGLAVRSIHSACREVLHRYLKLEPVIASEEDQPVTLSPNLNPAEIKLIGNVKEQSALRGILRHSGWRVTTVNLPKLPQGPSPTVLAPAEVEIL
jgi:hypothetical protein